ncbi:PREDICTED: uncharacterized protein LOC104818224 [Tarenaya hassleriana]|uniref:uncharacterized protein LOC104818224 n=1 Tax=Tarenaya hassleriana TaxID=28532 RepID=UPI00053C3841|nr:PREDICTED: uncharacterized protein LOC104818224 [Tarenaya hassleriana]
MISDSITNASATAAPSGRDFCKKKRANRSAKLKQCKLDARREQWLSQVAAKNKECKEEMNVNRRTGSEITDEIERDKSPMENLDRGRREEDNGGTFHHESFIDSPSNSSTSSILDGTDSCPNFSGSSSIRSSSSTSSQSGCFCSGSITEEEDGDDDGCLDDWEAVADALAANDKHEKENPPELCKEHVTFGQPASTWDPICRFAPDNVSGVGVMVDGKQDCQKSMSRMRKSNRAWRPDDELRPQILPNLSKQRSFPVMDMHYSSVATPSSCPICYEDLDLTDSNFLPCPCGFRLCLFCHKTICDGDGRCPGCRKPYCQDAIMAEASVHGGGLTIRLARSSSMFSRS